MGENTKIEWAHHSWSPWVGCSPVSPGCDHCYARAINRRAGGDNWGPGKERRVVSAASWANPRRWNRSACRLGTRFRVFPSMCDPFDPEVDEGVRQQFFLLITETLHLDWLLLTKRIEQAQEYLEREVYMASIECGAWLEPGEKLPTNLWLGVTAEDQQRADERIPLLLQIPAARRFVSVEPMLGPVSLDRWFGLEPGKVWQPCVCAEIDPGDRPCITCEGRRELGAKSGLHWVIAGGESGPRARPMDLDWVRAFRDSCTAARVPFMLKQVVERGHKVSLPTLDGIVWDQVPEVRP